ncbi:MAG: Y-family DNA polymerase [Chitinophagaceae bacterium]|nr:Y-family DNA polymerase [Chitinophagaceae bacterium]
MKAIIDCNSFYCSCERLFRPDLWNKPVVVLSNNDGCIVSRTDEAKKLGVGMAAPYYQNKDVIEKNDIAVFSSNYHLYGDLSMRVMDTLRILAGAHNIEVYSVDEAFLDLSMVPENKLYDAAGKMKEITEQWTGIKVSIGVAPSKVLSKIANKLSKKDKEGTRGIMILDSAEKIKDALEKTPVNDLWGIGRQYAAKLQNFGIENSWQLRNMPEEWCRKNLGGVVGVRMIRELKGESCIPMKDPLEIKKMIATTRMFGKPVHKLSDLKEAVATYASRAAEKIRRQHCAAELIHVFVVTNGLLNQKYEYNPQAKHCHITLPEATSNTNELIRYAILLAEKLFRPNTKYMKAGVILGGLVPDTSIQSNLFTPHVQSRLPSLMTAIDNINFSMRDDLVKYVATGLKRNWKMRQQLRSKRYTTRWDELFEIK